MKKFISLLLVLMLAFSTFSGHIVFAADISYQSEVRGSGFLSDEVAEKFVKLFYSQESSIQDSVKDILTGKEEGTFDEIKDIFENAVSFYELFDSDTVEVVVSKGAAKAVDNISDLTRIVSGVILIYDNGKSFAESTNAMQKTVDGLQMFYSVIDILGYSSYLPTGLSLVLSATDFALSLGGYLEAAYFRDTAALYQNELEIAYHTGEEIPYQKAPKIVIGSGVTQQEADSIFAQLYLEYNIKRMLDNFGGGANVTYEDMYSWPYEGEVTLLDKSVSVDSVRFICDEYTLFMNQSIKLPVRTFPKNAYNGRDISSYYSLKSTVISVDPSNGTITPVNPGVDYLYAVSNNGIEGKCKITVLPYIVSKTNNTYTLNKYYGDASVVKIPSVIDGVKVTSLGENCFYGCKNLKKVIIPNSITAISKYAFCGCQNLTDVTIPDSVESIGYGVFSQCTSLSNIIIPNSVTTICDYAFYKCSSLLNIAIPDSVSSIGRYAFSCCTSLTSVTIPDSVTSIASQSFEGCTNLTSVTIPDSVTSIGEYAFSRCENLTNIKIPDSVTSISDGAFSYCANLVDIKIPNSVKSIGNRAFYFCNYLISVTLGNGVTNIGQYAFCRCEGLSSVSLGSNLKSIGESAFSGCIRLNNIIIPDNVKYIGDGAFLRTKITNITIPDGITSIGNSTFYQCMSLKSIAIPNSVTRIEQSAFCGCITLTNITIPDSVNFIGDFAFSSCENLKSVKLPNGITSISENLFSCCYALENVTIPDSVTSIGKNSFHYCRNLKNILISDRITSIGEAAFDGCDSFVKITIPTNVTNIGDWAFRNCVNCKEIYVDNNNPNYSSHNGVLFDKNKEKLICYPGGKEGTSYTVPNSVTEICSGAFCGCSKLTETIEVPKSVKYIGERAFYGTKPKKLVLPFIGSRRGGDTFDNNTYNNQMCYLFSSSSDTLTTLKEVDITDETVVAPYAFLSCYNVTNIKLNEGVTKICDNAFENMDKLSKITIPESVTTINDKAFYQSPNVVIYCYKDSATHTFAETNGIRFELLDSYILGDADNDGSITIIDATQIQRLLALLIEDPDGTISVRGDVDRDVLSIMDATYIQRYIALYEVPADIGGVYNY